MRSRSFSVLVALATLACRRPPPGALADAGAGDAAPVVAAVADASTATPVGLVDLVPPPAALVAHNDRGVSLLGKNELDAAIAAFREALAGAPRFVLARYNLACALARSGQNDAAIAELQQVFELDWLGFRAQATRDADLVTLREKLPALGAAVEPRYAAVIARGVRALAWIGKPQQEERALAVRLGVWDDATQRFVAISTRRPHTIGALVSGRTSYAALVTGSLVEGAGHSSDTVTIDEISFWSWSTLGEPVGTIAPKTGANVAVLTLLNDRAQLDLNRSIPFPGSDHFAAQYTYDPTKPPAPRTLPKEMVFPVPTAAENVAELSFPGTYGFVADTRAAGHSVDKRTLHLPDGRTLELPADVAFVGAKASSIVVSPSQSEVVVVWDTHSCGTSCNGGYTVGAHRIVRVDVASGNAKVLEQGTGEGAVSFDAAGNLYVQSNRRASRWSEPPRPLPSGVLLVPPIVAEADVRCCGG